MSDNNGTISSPECCARLGISQRQIEYWARTDLLHPIRRGTGQGHHYRWPPREVTLGKFVVDALNLGVSLTRIRPLVGLFRAVPTATWAVIPLHGDTVIGVDHDDLAAAVDGCGTCIVIRVPQEAP